MNGTISLANLGGGAAIEKFDEELRRVLENVLDPNTEPRAKRKVRLEVTVHPDHDRTIASIAVSASSVLAAAVTYETRAHIGMREGMAVAFENNPRQMTIDDFVDANKEKVTPIDVAKEGGAS
jgi:hypothetical protein